MKKKAINVFMLTMINIATILSIRNWPITAEYGLSAIPLLLLAMVFFFVPTAFVSAELASGWPEKGGIFAWANEAMGPRIGMLAVWLLWVENVVWYPIILSFLAASFAFVINQSLATNQWYLFLMILGIFWTVTIANLQGMKISGWISTVGAIAGTILPGLLIICLGFLWLAMGYPSQISFSLDSLFPSLTNISQLAFLAGTLLSFCGMEMSAVHAKDVENPTKNYPRAIFFSSCIIITLTILGTLAIAIVTPKHDISLVAGGIEAIYLMLHAFGLSFLVPVIAIFISIGALAGVSSWVAGPCRGLLAASEKGDFPPFLQKVNKHGMPVNFMLLQGAIVSLLGSLFVFMPDVSSSFWILTVLAAQLYLIMYILMFLAGVILKYKRPNHKRPYHVPFGNIGMWTIASLGLIGSLFAIIVGFFPPEGIQTGGMISFEIFLLIGIAIFCGTPLLIYQLRRPSWQQS
ncbi:MAG: amino acid permease [Verrucomicrobia bacterium]|nr:amino acid permease [Verrucomicrobiota bacterium]